MLTQLGKCALVLNLLADVVNCQYDIFFHRRTGQYLGKYLIKISKAESEFDCSYTCVNEPKCVSVNFKVKGEDKGRCELNSRTLEEFQEDAQSHSEFVYLGIMKTCKDNEEFSVETKTCKEFFHSCQDLLSRYGNSPDGVYRLKSATSGEDYDVYCHMTDIATCGGGGWTLAMKLDGNKNTFIYGSPLWTNKETYEIQDGLEELTEKESKLASYWNTPFTKICLGMSYNGDRKWMTFDYNASSLYDVIADGEFRATTAGRAAWKSLIAGSSLQYHCNKEGFNVPFNGNATMRIGIVANNEEGCNTCDSWLGIGTYFYYDHSGWIRDEVCGNYATCCYPDNGGKDLNTFGYIFVQ